MLFRCSSHFFDLLVNSLHANSEHLSSQTWSDTATSTHPMPTTIASVFLQQLTNVFNQKFTPFSQTVNIPAPWLIWNPLHQPLHVNNYGQQRLQAVCMILPASHFCKGFFCSSSSLNFFQYQQYQQWLPSSCAQYGAATSTQSSQTTIQESRGHSLINVSMHTIPFHATSNITTSKQGSFQFYNHLAI